MARTTAPLPLRSSRWPSPSASGSSPRAWSPSRSCASCRSIIARRRRGSCSAARCRPAKPACCCNGRATRRTAAARSAFAAWSSRDRPGEQSPFRVGTLGRMDRPPLPPFTLETATQKVRMAEDAWNTRDPARVALAYTVDSRWRNRVEFLQGRAAIEAFLTRKWSRELDYRLIKELWTFHDNRIAVRFAYEWHDDSGNWFRSYGNENWEFDEHGLMRKRYASINDLPIGESDRKFHWDR